MAQHLTTPDSVKNNVRPVSNHIADDRINIYIDEAEQINIKPRIGDALMLDLIKYVDDPDKSTYPVLYGILLNGGEYDFPYKINCNENATVRRSIKGLITSLEYYVYSKLVKNQNLNVTRFGFVAKDDPYSHQNDLKVTLAAEKDALTIADKYLEECIDFLDTNQNLLPLYFKNNGINRLNIKIVGK